MGLSPVYCILTALYLNDYIYRYIFVVSVLVRSCTCTLVEVSQLRMQLFVLLVPVIFNVYASCIARKVPPVSLGLESFGVKQKDGKFLGLLVKSEFARRFVEGPEDSRKVMEIRSRAVTFLSPEDRIILLSTSGGTGFRRALAILEFEMCIKIPDAKFSKYFQLHQVSEEEFAKYKGSLSKPSDHLFGYQFALVHTFPDEPILQTKGGEIWVYVGESDFKRQPGNEGELRRIGVPELKVGGSSSSITSNSCQSLGVALKSAADDTPNQQGNLSEEENAEGDSDAETDGENEEEVHPGSDAVLCTCLLLSEWTNLREGTTSSILRPNEPEHMEAEVVVMVRGKHGHTVVGQVVVRSALEIDRKCRETICNRAWSRRGVGTMYTENQLKNMLLGAKVWKWKIRDVAAYDEPATLRYFCEQPSQKSKMFFLKRSQLCDCRKHVAKIPASMTFLETADWFVNQLPDEMQASVAQTVYALAKTNSCIRIGTTCSGTDVCVAVLRDTVEWLNRWKVGLEVVGVKHGWFIYIYVYVYVYVYVFRYMFYNQYIYTHIIYIYVYMCTELRMPACRLDQVQSL